MRSFRTNRCAIAVMFVHLSVCLSGTGTHCDHNDALQRRFNFSIWLDSPMLGAPWHQSMSTYSQFHLEESWAMDVQTIARYLEIG